MKTLISNPPYNLKWKHPMFAKMQDRFINTIVPPENNANFAFILTALNESDKSAFILPNCVLSTTTKEEIAIKKYLVDSNYIESIINCPDKMFESTSIPVTVLLINKNKTTTKIEMINMSDTFDIEVREQNGQFGSKSHTERTYKKEVKIFNDEHIEKIKYMIDNSCDEKGISKSVSIEDIKLMDYNLNPKIYIENIQEETKTRSYEDIINDLNRVIKNKNMLKITCNENIAKNNDLKNIFDNFKKSQEMNKEIREVTEKLFDIKIEKENFISLSKNKNELSFSNNSKEDISHILLMIIEMWKQHIYFLNNEENRYLSELRDKLLPDLMEGKIDLENIEL